MDYYAKAIQDALKIAVLLSAAEGLLDDVPIARIAESERVIAEAVTSQLPDVCDRIERGEALETTKK